MKIGILTVYSFNYGSFFQATSLYKKLEEMGYECEFINERFKQFRWGNLFLLYTFDGILPGFVKPILAARLPQYETYLQLKKDVSHYRESPKDVHDMRRITSRYDCVVLGADEMWSANKKSIRYMPEHFGEGIACPHISYATCGSLFDIHNKKLLRKAAKGMRTFSSIAVRDEYTKKIADRLTKGDHPVVLDPTLLHPYFIREKDRDRDGSYLLLYGQHYSPKQREFIRNKSKEMGLPIKALGWPQDFAQEFLDPASAEEFQDCFSDAAYCFPSTFHGTIFSILHHKPFLSMTNSLRGKKVKMLLEQLDLTFCLFDENGENRPKIDYEKVEECLAQKRAFSEAYLKEALLKIGCMPSGKDSGTQVQRKRKDSEKGKDFEKGKDSGLNSGFSGDMICPSASCTGCFSCQAVCPAGAIGTQEDRQGFLRVAIDKTLCINCNLCRNVCPQNEKTQNRKEPSALYGAFSKNVKLVRKSSSGGIFGELASYVLENGGTVYGAAFDEKKEEVFYRRITGKADLEQLFGSKYVQSKPGGFFSLLKKDLKDNKTVLFAGTPCQVEGIQAYVRQVCPEEEKHLITADLLCHGVPSPRIFRDYIREQKGKEKDEIASLTFRDKTYGWRKQAIAIHFAGGNVYRKRTDADPYYRLYFKNLMLRPSCYACNYIDRNRVGDITLGDYWGAEDTGRFTRNQVKNGISYVSVQSEKGRQLLDDVADRIILAPADEKSSYQPLFDRASKCPDNYSAFWEDYFAHGYSYVAKKYSRYGWKERLVKKVIAPAAKMLGIYKIAQKIYFVFSK